MESTFKDYVAEATEDSFRGIAARLGMDHTSLRRQISGEARLTVETVVHLCREYSLPIGPAFVVAGFLTPEEVAGMNTRLDIRSFTDKELAKEMLRRVTQDASVDVPIQEDDDPFLALPHDDEGALHAMRHARAARRRRG